MGTSEIQKANRKYIDTFENWLQKKGFSKKTIANHVNNVDFYINDFLYGYFEMDVVQGCSEVGRFLGNWFIRKASWSSCAHIKGNAASFKKFYACMVENGVVNKEDYYMLCVIIKADMPSWLEEMQSYEAMYESDYFFL